MEQIDEMGILLELLLVLSQMHSYGLQYSEYLVERRTYYQYDFRHILNTSSHLCTE
jgi:hypothetical protein